MGGIIIDVIGLWVQYQDSDVRGTLLGWEKRDAHGWIWPWMNRDLTVSANILK